MPVRKDQVFIGFKCDAEFRDQLTDASGGALSQFVRDALIEKLQRLHIPVSRALAAPPSRLGKGGPRKVIRFQQQQQQQSDVAAETPEPSAVPLSPRQSVQYPKPKKKPKP